MDEIEKLLWRFFKQGHGTSSAIRGEDLMEAFDNFRATQSEQIEAIKDEIKAYNSIAL